jgi:hypothetical protein
MVDTVQKTSGRPAECNTPYIPIELAMTSDFDKAGCHFIEPFRDSVTVTVTLFSVTVVRHPIPVFIFYG